jgi:diacylglycerol kinase family enzyme
MNGARPRIAAVGALVFGALGFLLVLASTLDSFPRGLIVAALVVAAAIGAWYVIVGPLSARILGSAGAVAALAVALLLVTGDGLLELSMLIGAVALCCVCARLAFGFRADLRPVSAPERPVLFFNPRSGGGKAERFGLADAARSRGFQAIELSDGADLEGLVRTAVRDGADALAMAGGDGSQAIVASVAAEAGLPYACIPAGTRNHFAADLGVDRDDVVGSLDAFVDGGERRVDLADVNGRVFVNNVSLGLYAEAVQRRGYRDAKLKTVLEVIPDTIGPDGTGLDLTWVGPGGHEHRSGVAILVSNNRYRLGRAIGSGTRPRIDDGLLGITVAGAPRGRGGRWPLQRPWREWTATEFTVEADHAVPAGIDGEAARIDPPLRFRIHPAALRVRISQRHPGASPSAALPEGLREGIRALIALAAGRTAPTTVH